MYTITHVEPMNYYGKILTYLGNPPAESHMKTMDIPIPCPSILPLVPWKSHVGRMCRLGCSCINILLNIAVVNASLGICAIGNVPHTLNIFGCGSHAVSI